MQEKGRVIAALLLSTALAVPAARATFDAGIFEVREYGNPRREPLIFVPGLACGAWIWDYQIASLSPAYHVFVVTLPGFDGRPFISGRNPMRQAVNSLHELIEMRHLVHPVVVGHSLGGTIAVMFGETYPRDAAGIVTVEGGYPVAPTQALRDKAVARSIAPYKDLGQDKLGSALRTNMLQYTITRKDDVERVAALAGKSDPKAIVGWMKAALSLDLTPELSRITVPFTAIVPYDPGIDPYVGFKTQASKESAYEAWVAHASRGRLILIPGARHFVMIDKPKAFESALERAIIASTTKRA